MNNQNLSNKMTQQKSTGSLLKILFQFLKSVDYLLLFINNNNY